MKPNKIFVVIPTWKGKESIGDCLTSLLSQSKEAQIIVVDNGSRDGSAELIKNKFSTITLLEQTKNIGFAGGVNMGIKLALDEGANYVALFNDDAVADKYWLEKLFNTLDSNTNAGIVTGKIMDSKHTYLDSTGDYYTIWGLPYPRGRGEPVSNKYDNEVNIFAASGGASLYRTEMLHQIGLFDEKFFAYYEDVDLSFRAQLAGWKVVYEPAAIAYHQIGATSSKIKGFTTYQTMKNLPMIVRKNVPLKLLPKILPRFWLAYSSFYISAVARGQFWPATKGWFVALINLPRNFYQRRDIQKNRKVTVDYIDRMIIHDLPPNASRLRSLRQRWWRLSRKSTNG